MKIRVCGVIALAIAIGVPRPATADVIAKAALFHVLDGTSQLRRSKSDETLANSRFYRVMGSDAQGFILPDLDDYGALRNGQDLLILPLGSGGSGGVFYALLFTGIRSGKPRFIGYIPSPAGHLAAYISGGQLIVATPIFRGKDPNCCPSSETETTYAIEGITMTKIESRIVNYRVP